MSEICTIFRISFRIFTIQKYNDNPVENAECDSFLRTYYTTRYIRKSKKTFKRSIGTTSIELWNFRIFKIGNLGTYTISAHTKR